MSSMGASAVVYLKTFAAGETAAAGVFRELLESLHHMQRTELLLVYMSPFPCIGASDNKLVPVE